jgi:hypothetical protein
MKWVKGYLALIVDEEFSPKQARSITWRLFKMKYLPHRLYASDYEALTEGRLVLKTRQWRWRGRTLHTKTLNKDLGFGGSND